MIMKFMNNTFAKKIFKSAFFIRTVIYNNQQSNNMSLIIRDYDNHHIIS
jgi:hypothetical protein